MSDATLLTSAKIAAELGASPAKVKKTIEALGIESASRRGVCAFYDADAVAKIAASLKG